MVIEEHGVQRQLIFRGKAAVAEGFQLFFVLAADLVCIFHICGDSAKRSFFSSDTLFFRMCQGIMEGKGAAGNFILKNFSGKGFEFSVFCDPVSGKITGSKAGEKCQDKKQSDENRRFIFPDFKRHKTIFHYCLQTYTMCRVLMVSKQTVTSFQSGALFYHIGKLRNL